MRLARSCSRSSRASSTAAASADHRIRFRFPAGGSTAAVDAHALDERVGSYSTCVNEPAACVILVRRRGNMPRTSARPDDPCTTSRRSPSRRPGISCTAGLTTSTSTPSSDTCDRAPDATRSARATPPRRGIVRTRILDEIDPFARQAKRQKLIRRERHVEVDPQPDLLRQGSSDFTFAVSKDAGGIVSRPVTGGMVTPSNKPPRILVAPRHRARRSATTTRQRRRPRSNANCSSSGTSPSSGHGCTSANPSPTRISAPSRGARRQWIALSRRWR